MKYWISGLQILTSVIIRLVTKKRVSLNHQILEGSHHCYQHKVIHQRWGGGESKMHVLFIPVEFYDSKVKWLKQLGRYFLIWFSKSFLLIINSLINTSKFLWASLLGKILIHESSSKHTFSFLTGIQEFKKEILWVCKWKDKVSLSPF